MSAFLETASQLLDAWAEHTASVRLARAHADAASLALAAAESAAWDARVAFDRYVAAEHDRRVQSTAPAA